MSHAKNNTNGNKLSYEKKKQIAIAVSLSLLVSLWLIGRHCGFNGGTTPSPYVPSEPLPSISAIDCTAAIDRMLSGPDDSSMQTTVQETRIGPGEGGKLTPLTPAQRQQMTTGKKTPGLRAAKSDSLVKVNTGKLEPGKGGDSLKAHQPPVYR